MDRIQDKEIPNMIPDRCTFCRGTLKEGKSQFIARVENEVIVVRDIPAFVCEQCGEAYYSVDISEKIDEVMKDAHNGTLCVKPLAAGEVELNV
jgi:YgiT-type zinc finger domain-containing protein